MNIKEPLSHLVKYKNTIGNTDINSELIKIEFDNVINACDKSNICPSELQKLKDKRKEFEKKFKEFKKEFKEYKNSVDSSIRETEKEYLSQSYKLYEDKSEGYVLEDALYQTLIYKPKISDYFISRLKSHSSWKYAALWIRPEYGQFVDQIIGSDPLYIMDDNPKYLRPIQSFEKWTTEFQNRIRYSFINEEREDKLFGHLPKEQMNLVVVYNYFNYRPIHIIERYLTEIYDLISDGGTCIFTYNNCDLDIAVNHFEKGRFSYTPFHLLSLILDKIGFDIVESFDDILSNVSWLEIKKPGTLSSIRGGQCLGIIK